MSYLNLLMKNRNLNHDTFSFKKPISKKNISHKQFIKNPRLIKQHGFWNDSDNDGVLNFADCYPFNKKRHAIIPTELQAQRPQIPLTQAEVKAIQYPQQLAPQKTEAQIINEMYQTAISDVNKKIKEVDVQIEGNKTVLASMQESYNQARGPDALSIQKSMNDIRKEINLLNARRGGYQEVLSGTKEEVINKSGYAGQLASYREKELREAQKPVSPQITPTKKTDYNMIYQKALEGYKGNPRAEEMAKNWTDSVAAGYGQKLEWTIITKQATPTNTFNLPYTANYSLPYQTRGTANIIVTPTGREITTSKALVFTSPPEVPTVYSMVRSAANIPTNVGRGISEISTKLNLIPFTIQEKKTDISLPYQTRGTANIIVTPKETKKVPSTISTIIPEQKTSVSEQAGKVLGFGAATLFYVSPYTRIPLLVASTIAGGMETFDITGKSLTKTERIIGGVEAGISGTFLTYDIYRLATKPIVTITKKPQTQKFIEVQQPRGEKLFAKYEIITKQPAPTVKVTNPFREFFGMKPLFEDTISPDRIYKTFTQDFVEVGKPFEVITKRVGGKINWVKKIGGESMPLDKEAFSQLSKAQQYVWQNIAERQVGRPVPLKIVPKILSENFENIQSNIYGQDLFRFTQKGAKSFRVDIKSPISTNQEFIAGTLQKEVATPSTILDMGGSPISFTPDVKTFKSATIFKSIFGPTASARASGKTSLLTGTTYVLPSIEGEATEQAFKQILSTGRRSSQEFIQSLYQAPKIIPSIPKSVPKAVTDVISTSKTSFIDKTLSGLATGVTTITLQSNKQIASQTFQNKLETPQTTENVIKTITNLKLPSEQINKESVIEYFTFKTPQSIKITPSLETPNLTTPRVPPPTIPTPRVPPKEPPPIIPPFYFPEKKKVPLKKKKYIAEIRRGKKFYPVTTPAELETAFGFGLKKVQTTLAASFRLREAETGKVIPLRVPSGQFRFAKKESGVIVQKRSFRLGSIFERREIQKARKLAMANPFR